MKQDHSSQSKYHLQEVMLRRLKREVMSQLPAKRRQVVRLPRPRPSDWPTTGAYHTNKLS